MKEWFNKLGNIYVKYFFYFISQNRSVAFQIKKKMLLKIEIAMI